MPVRVGHSESINLEHGNLWGHYDPETNPLGTRLKAAIEEAGNVSSAIGLVGQSASLDPDQFAGVSGTAFQLVVQGDGSEHTLEIKELVAPTKIAPEGQTTIDFTVVGDPGELDILLDGKSVGTFERQAASGATDS